MTSKKKTTTKKTKPNRSNAHPARAQGNTEIEFPLSERTNGARRHPRLLENETSEEREKRLAKRKALTLKAFQMAYENHHKRKAS